MIRILITTILLGSAIPAVAQQPPLRIEDFEPILLPTTGGRPGANGSVWSTEMLIRNDAEEPAIFGIGDPACILVSCPSPVRQIPPLTTEVVELGAAFAFPLTGKVMYVERRFASMVTLNLRLRETSRNASRPGTNIPVIRENELRSGKIQLLNVPQSSTQRINLRVFEIDWRASAGVVRGPRVLIRIFAEETLVWAEEMMLIGFGQSSFTQNPAEMVINGLETRIPVSACCDPLRIEVEPLDAGRYWAHVHVVDNATQEVLIVTPE